MATTGTAVQLAVEVTYHRVPEPERPALVPAEFCRDTFATGELSLNAWMCPDTYTGTLLHLLEDLVLDEGFAELLWHSVAVRGDSPMLILSRDPMLNEEVQAVEGFEGLFMGKCLVAGKKREGYSREPGDYQSLWWSTLEDWEGNFVMRLGERWYAAVMQRAEQLLGFEPHRVALPHGFQRSILAHREDNVSEKE